jgi:hypothetical protein
MLVSVLCALAVPVSAETLVVGDQVSVRASSIPLPQRGSGKSAVETRFGAPRAKHDAVGSPPITRWDYEGFSVYFEHDHVVHAVAVGG